QAGLGNNPNLDTVVTNIRAGASFTDYLTVQDTVRPFGTEVQVPFQYLAEVVSNYSLGYPYYSRHPIGVYASFIIPGIGPQNFSTESGYFPWTRTTLPNGNGLYVVGGSPFNVTAHVGDVLAISATLGIFGDASVSATTYERDFGGFADARNTAAIWLGTLPAGMTITSASGHDYTINPTLLAPVPEPESYAMLLAGLACVGLLVRRRNGRRNL
ncbi:MAG: PEP-CTERM sorting domain-containing protein, partial [Burkholderiaceae bacterium]